MCQSARLGLAKLTGKGKSRQFLTAPTSESDTKVRSMIVWQALVMKVGALPLLHKNRFEFRIKSKRDSPLSFLFGQPHWV